LDWRQPHNNRQENTARTLRISSPFLSSPKVWLWHFCATGTLTFSRTRSKDALAETFDAGIKKRTADGKRDKTQGHVSHDLGVTDKTLGDNVRQARIEKDTGENISGNLRKLKKDCHLAEDQPQENDDARDQD
jgi:hypothetical protein